MNVNASIKIRLLRGISAALLSAMLLTSCAGPVVPDADISAPASATVSESAAPSAELTPSPEPTPEPYTLVEVDSSLSDAGGLVLVNWKHGFSHTDDAETVVISENASDALLYASAEARLAPDALDALNALAEKFRSVSGGSRLYVTSAYRTLEYQKGVYDDYVKEHGEDAARLYVANPGYSEHHTGLAADLSTVDASGKRVTVLDSEYGPWLSFRCAEYGFILRYPIGTEAVTHIAYEPWHFRYVGVPNALAVTELDVTYDEYVEMLRQYTPESGMLHVDSAGTLNAAMRALSAAAETDAPAELPTAEPSDTDAPDTALPTDAGTDTDAPNTDAPDTELPAAGPTDTVPSETPSPTEAPTARPTPIKLPTPPVTAVPTPRPHIAELDVVYFGGLPDSGWLIYYVPASASAKTEIPIPAGAAEYTVSGDNCGGFIVTVAL